MKRILLAVAVAALPALAQAQTGVNWAGTAGGTLGASTVTVSGFTSGATILPYDLSVPTYYSGAPLSSSQDCMDHHCDDAWTANFSPAVSGLTWYGKWTRGINSSTNNTPASYTFNHPFTILSGFSAGTINGNTLTIPGTGFHHGILQFSGSVSTLTCTSTNTWGSFQAMNLGEAPTASVGANYCGPAVANTSGSPASMGATGTASVSSNDLVLEASNMPNNSFGFFLTSLSQGFVANPGGSQGNLCLGGAIGRFVGPGQIQNSGATGAISLAVDNSMQPTPAGLVQVVAGETWNYQAWFRDSNGMGGATSNFTDGLEVTHN